MNQTAILSLIGLALCGILMFSVGRRIGHLELWCGVVAGVVALTVLVTVEPNEVHSAMAAGNGIFVFVFGKRMGVPLANYMRRFIVRRRMAKTELRAPDSHG